LGFSNWTVIAAPRMYRQKLLKNWTDAQIEQMRHSIFVGEHRLGELDLFTDEALARALDAHPRKDLGVFTMGSNPARRQTWQEGDAGDLDGRTLLELTKKGRLFLTLRRLMDHHTVFHEAVNLLYDELETLSGESIFERLASLQISSPTAGVYFQVDCRTTMLWQIRGKKRIWMYPMEDGAASAETIESALIGEEIAYRRELDRHAKVVDLGPRQVITWPQHTPYRAANTRGLNVTLLTEHVTRLAQRRNNVHLANRHFRRLYRRGFSSTEVEGPAAALKEAAIRVVRRLPLVAPPPPRVSSRPITFAVDPQARGGVRLLDAPYPSPDEGSGAGCASTHSIPIG
jgi:hypothetical protein